MTTDEAVSMCDAVRNLAALYGYEMTCWGSRFIVGDQIVEFRRPGLQGRLDGLRGHAYWPIERWIMFFKINDAVLEVTPKDLNSLTPPLKKILPTSKP